MSASTESKLASLAAGQWGLLTAAQASSAGIARSTLLRRERGGGLSRVRYGVYRVAGAPADPLDGIRAAWLASKPEDVATERRRSPDVIVGGAAAAAAHGLGDLYPSPYLLYAPTRRRSAQDDVRYTTRRLPAGDVTVLHGLPVTTRERTLVDLLDEPGSDLSIVADALRDAELSGSDLDTVSLIRRLDAVAPRFGYRDGTALHAHLRTLSGVDAERIRDLVHNTDFIAQWSAQANAALEAQLHEVLTPIQSRLDAQARRLIEPLLRSGSLAMPSVDTTDLALPPTAAPQFNLPPGIVPRPVLSQSTIDLIDRLSRTWAEGPRLRSSATDADVSADEGPADQ